MILGGLLVIDELDEDMGLAEVQDSLGRSFQLPAEWLPEARDGASYRVSVAGGQVTFTPDAAAAQLLREQSKQTLLDFQDESEQAESGQADSGQACAPSREVQ